MISTNGTTSSKVACMHGKFRDDCAVCEHIAYLNRRILFLEEENANLRAMLRGINAQHDLMNHNK